MSMAEVTAAAAESAADAADVCVVAGMVVVSDLVSSNAISNATGFITSISVSRDGSRGA